MPVPRMVALLALSALVLALLAAGAVEIARQRERADASPDPYEPYRQTVQALSRVTPTLDAYSRGQARVQTMVAGLPTAASRPARTPTYPAFTLGDVYRCADAYARGQGALSIDCWDDAVDACVRDFLSATGASFPSYQCDAITVSGTGSPATQSQIEACVRAAFGETSSPFAAMNCRD